MDIASTMKTVLKFSNGVNDALVVYAQNENLLITVVYRHPMIPGMAISRQTRSSKNLSQKSGQLYWLYHGEVLI